MSRPQLTLSLLLGLVAWVLSAMPAPKALAGAEAHDVIAARMCGWLDIEAGSVEGAPWGGERAETPGSPRVNTLRFRLASPAPAAAASRPTTVEPNPQVESPESRLPRSTAESLVRWRRVPEPSTAVEAEDPIVWLTPTISRWAQRPQVEAAQHAAFLVLGNWGAAARPAYGRPAPMVAPPIAAHGIGREAADAAATWLGDRCPILMRVRPAAPRASMSASRVAPTNREAAAMLAAAMAGMAEILRDWSMQLEQAAAQPSAIPPAIEEPAAARATPEWSEPAASLLILGL